MQKKTLDKLRRYIDLTARLSLPTGDALPALREKAWQEFVEAVLAEDHVPDDFHLDQIFVDLMGRGGAP